MQSFRYVFTMIVIFSASFLAPHNMALKSTFSRRAGPPAGDEKKCKDENSRPLCAKYMNLL